ncbi:MAG TPA: RluA family pseudouridine synthase [Thermoanaerobaculia bacterium]|nr:RluA family pseudouridine synthase [Thermoanaerobaculia bacterium]
MNLESSKRRFRVGAPSAGTRLDLFLASVCSDLSRSRLQRLIEQGAVRVEGVAVKRSHVVRKGEEVTLEVPAPRPLEILPEAIPFTVLYEDEHLLAIDKPAGLVVHPSPGHDSGTLVHGLLHHVRDLTGVGGELRPGIVHRLDRDTSGVLLVAKTDLAHGSLSRQMKKRAMRKDYLALVAGIPTVRKGEVALPVGRDPRDRKKMKAFRASDAPPSGARDARTLYEIEREFFALGLTLLRCRLVTGRTHQIRVHLAAAGLPVVGDPAYGRPRYAPLRDLELKARLTAFPRQALHAERIAFRHPATNAEMEIVAPLPPDLKELLGQIESASRNLSP